jgi:plastocyanin
VDPRKGGLAVGFGEFAITPEAKAIRPGRVTFEVRNGGKLVHGFEMKSEDEGGSNRGHGGGDDDRFKVETSTFGPGETVRVVAFLEPGLYELECFVADHDERGMRTLLRVDPDAPFVRPKREDPGSVSIASFAFQPARIEVPAGSKVTWTNGDPTEHTVTAENGSFGSDPFGDGGRFAFTFDRVGAFSYRCAIHPAMRGTVEVR